MEAAPAPLTTAQRLAQIRLQKEEMELEIMGDQVLQMRNKRLQAEQDRARQTRDIQEAERVITANQAACTHKKGGKDKNGLTQGNDSNYAVWTHTYPTGHVIVMCSRCRKEWQKPLSALARTNPEQYAKQELAFQTALALPTDNVPSGKRLFLFERIEQSAA